MNKTMLSVVVAVYNESVYNLHALIERLEKVLPTLNMSYEVVFVNDGSREETSNSLKELCQQHDYIKLISLSRNFGQQAAISAGINFASGQAIVNMDSDLQDPPELIPDMVRLWQRGFEVIYAKRLSRKDSILKSLSAFLFYRTMSLLSAIEIPEDTGEFRLIDCRVAKALQQLPERARYIRGLLPWLGFKSTTIPVDRHARQHGKSSYTLRKLVTLALDGILCFSYAPLYAILLVGLTTIFISFLIPLLTACLSNHHVPRLVWAMSGVVFLFGLQFFLLGIVSCYVARIFHEVKARPIYVVSEIAGRPFEIGKNEGGRERFPQQLTKDRTTADEFDANPRTSSAYPEKLDYITEQNTD